MRCCEVSSKHVRIWTLGDRINLVLYPLQGCILASNAKPPFGSEMTDDGVVRHKLLSVATGEWRSSRDPEDHYWSELVRQSPPRTYHTCES